jgi:O-antigen ligase
MLGMALSLGLVRVLHEPNARRRLWYGVACVVIGAGALATQRKTAMVAPVAAFLVLLAYRPQSARRLAPLAVVVVVVAQIFVPGALHNLKAEFLGLDKSNSTSARAADYEAVKPDVLAKPMLGRGFGSYDPHVYRYLDNQILMLVIEVGAIGTLSYLLIFGVAQLKAGPIIRRGPPLRAELALGAAAGIGAYVVSNLLFDVLAFRQVPYVMCFLLAVVAIAAREETSGQRLDVDRPLL